MVKKIASPNEETRWFTPPRLLVLLCVVNLLNYVDRGVIASNGVNGTPREPTCKPLEICQGGSGIQGEFDLSNLQDGILSSVFLVGLLIASPIFAYMSKMHNSFKLMGFGLSVWTFATAMCGFAFNFWSITAARMLVGVGEASFISLASPFIRESAPHNKRSSWLAYFYMCIPAGMALGYVYGGVVGSSFTWRVAFWGESVLMLPCALIGFAAGFAQNKANKMDKDITNPKEAEERMDPGNGKPVIPKSLSMHLKAFCGDVKMLFQSKIYTVSVAGSVAFNAVLGAYSYWGPRAGYAIFNLTDADFVFGCMTAVCAVIGTPAGGNIFDSIGATSSNGFKLLTVATSVGGIACFVSFLSKSLYSFIPLFAVGELFLFATQSPVNDLILGSASEELQPLATAVSTICIHVFGDVPSAPLVGAMQDYLKDWQITTLLLTTVFFLAAFIWGLGILIPAAKEAALCEKVDLEESQEKVPFLEKR
ncbi:hypothetical protein GOP47_0025612 [Adiantum capillus-veneris]|uniref:Major facilitator superfamily (MFS) profile domain-containing protein n=1 Tax=Adiantum capillus-veneris TaxID=13818 RepID=A0A9D4U0V6_ADICA|nr:hypothetical protein GOP47_0025612 [Adiantum capillus-veneris]